MVYTLTCNPSLDYHMPLMRVHIGEMNRSKETRIVAGGKGLNVSTVLKSFGVETKALSFIGGFTGDEWIRLVEESGIPVDVVSLPDGQTRINVKIDGIDQTEFNAAGPSVTREKLVEGYRFFELVKPGDMFCICGNGLVGMNQDAYANAMEYVMKKGARVVLDATGELMRQALCKRPLLIKPNLSELKDIANTAIDSEEDIIECSERLMKMGAQNVLVSLGKNGAIFVGADGMKYRIKAPKGRVVSSVGSGDSMVAAFIYGIENNMDIKDCLRLSVAAGSACAFSEKLATREDAYAILEKVEIERIR